MLAKGGLDRALAKDLNGISAPIAIAGAKSLPAVVLNHRVVVEMIHAVMLLMVAVTLWDAVQAVATHADWAVAVA